MTTVRDLIETLLYADNLDLVLDWGNEYIDTVYGEEMVCLNIYARGTRATLTRPARNDVA